MNNPVSYILIAILLGISAFFSASEIAFAGISSTRLKSRLQEGCGVSVILANKIKEDYNDSLSTILIGNNLANSASSAIATAIVIALFTDKYAWVSTVIMTVLVLIFGEIIPKVLAKNFAEKFAIAVAVPLYILICIFKPVNWIIMLFVNQVSKIWSKSISDTEAVSADDLENIIDIVEEEGVLDEEQCDLLQNALDFDNVAAYEIITPRVDMEAIDIRDPYEVNIKKIIESTYSRIPVYEDTPDNIIGILHMNRVYKELIDNEKISIRKLLLPVTFVHKTMPIPDVLEKMKETKCHMVVVLDEYGGTLGILSMEDVLEQLVGEIWDETDDIELEREFTCIDDTHFEAIGDMRVYDFFDEFDIDIEEDETFEADSPTVGGWVVDMLDGEIEEGASFTFENLLISVKEADEKRIERISVEVLENEDEDQEDDDD